MSRLKGLPNPRNLAARRALPIGFAVILGFVLFGITSIQTWEYSNSVSFCANGCHNVHPEESRAFQDSYHARVKCTECHMGRVGTLQNIVLKASHLSRLPKVLFDDYERPHKSESLRPANESCERCHWPPAFHADTVREIKRYGPDENSTEKRTYLILRTGGGEREKGFGDGIHWHIENKVEFIATGEHKQEIRWVRTTLPDGRTVEYNDVTSPMSPEEFAEAEVKVMDCVDCHNRVGHPFPSPEQAIDNAIAKGRLSRELPFIKKEIVDLLGRDYPSQEAALSALEAIETQYKATYPEVAVTRAVEIQQAAEVAKELLTRLVFEEPGVTWHSFPDNSQHKEFAGCFRCHDGEHLSSDGESIRLQCNLCHSVPVTVGEGDRPPQMPVVSIDEPASHLDANFMRDHRFQADDSCVACHGEVSFGSDDSSFCANSACHGQGWPEVELEAAFPHPIELEGKHAEVWCQDCHKGTEKPDVDCAVCHDPPERPHFGELCEDCHTPDGFEPANLDRFQHPVALEGEHAALECSECHVADKDLIYECAACHEPPAPPHFGDRCEDCHVPDGFKPANLDGFKHPVLLEGEHASIECSACHAAGQELVYECTACHVPPENHLKGACDTCHAPQGWKASAASLVAPAPVIPHALEGLDQCLLCHNPSGANIPAPDNHDIYEEEQCILCHKTAP